LIESHLESRRAGFASLSVEGARLAAAEINGLAAWYGGQPARGNRDHHCLLSSHTWLGRESAGIVADWLRNHGVGQVDIHALLDLRMDDAAGFGPSLADLLKWCRDRVAPWRSPKNRVIFNLSGGFKAVSGFLQTLGMFYADETVYVFEGSSRLMRIPRLPVAMADEPAVREDLRDFRGAALALPVAGSKEGVYWMGCDGQYALTAWGDLVFDGLRPALYAGRLHPPPSDLVRYGPRFAESCRERLEDVNRKVDLLAKCLEDPRRPNPRTLDFKALAGKGPPSAPEATHEMDAWSDGAAKRIYVRLEGGVATLLRLDRKL